MGKPSQNTSDSRLKMQISDSLCQTQKKRILFVRPGFRQVRAVRHPKLRLFIQQTLWIFFSFLSTMNSFHIQVQDISNIPTSNPIFEGTFLDSPHRIFGQTSGQERGSRPKRKKGEKGSIETETPRQPRFSKMQKR